MPKVYFTQIPHKRHEGKLIPAFNVSSAGQFGEIVTIMPPQTAFTNTKILARQVDDEISKYRYEDGDVVVLLGDPVVIATTIAVLARYCSIFAVLKWDKNLGRYLKTVVNVDFD